jgi:signal transduction histidine kinase
LTESTEQQTATAEILRVISASPTDIKPVFDTIVKSAARLCDGVFATLFRFDGEMIHWVSQHGSTPEGLDAMRQRWPRPPGPETIVGRAVIDRRVIHVRDSESDPDVPSETQKIARAFGYRSVVSVPMLHQGQPVGGLSVARRTQPFSPAQISLLQIFADQAVIAIETVRLFTETRDALRRQTATSEILRVISSSPTDVQPVFDAVAASAARVCEALDAVIFRVDGNALRLVAHQGAIGAHAPLEGPPLVRGTPPGRAVLDGRTIHVTFGQGEDDEYAEGREMARRFGHRTALCVPLRRAGKAIGVIAVRRTEARPFTDGQVELLETFADQAVIAIENVRLFTELKDKNDALAEALQQQTATAEILRVISNSPSDLQPVFETIVRNAVELCGAAFGGLHRLAGGRITLDAQYGVPVDELEILRRDVFPLPASRDSATGRAMLDRTVVHIRDIRDDSRFQTPHLKTMQSYRTVLAVPMLREDVPIGALAVWRREVQPFSESETELVKTFADQAVIAIENVRLFNELETRTAALTRSVEQLTALGEVGRAVGSTLDLATVLTTIVSRAVELSGLDGGLVSEYDETAEEFVQRATAEIGEALPQALREVRYRKGEGAIGRTAITREPVQVADITIQGMYESRVRDTLIESGVRAVLAVPMIHQNRLIGCLGVTRKRPGQFPTETIELLRTFATQSALAIQNARLFHEIEEKSRQLELASRHKSEFLANMSHELRTPLNAVLGFSEVLRERMFGDLNDKQDEYLNDIHASGQHLLSLINDILDLSKIEAGRMELEVTDFYLPAALDNALTLLRERAGRRGIVLHAGIDDRIEHIRGDERKIKQVLLNLLSNAIKFTPEGGRIEVRVALRDGGVEVSVRDTGVGIAPEDQGTIFEEFRQVGTAAKKVEGTGLGLALSRKFVELHGGRISVESQVGVGSTFTFTIPKRPDP